MTEKSFLFSLQILRSDQKLWNFPYWVDTPPVYEKKTFLRRMNFDSLFPEPFKMFRLSQFTKCHWFSYTLSSFDLVYPRMYTSHEIGMVKEAEHFILSQRFFI